MIRRWMKAIDEFSIAMFDLLHPEWKIMQMQIAQDIERLKARG